MGSNSSRVLIGILGERQGENHKYLFAALELLFPASFCWPETTEHDGLGAVVVLDGDVTRGLAAAVSGLPAFVFRPKTATLAATRTSAVSFGKSPWVDHTLSGQTLWESPESDRFVMPGEGEDEILAATPEGAVWLARPTTGKACLICSATPPALRKGEFLLQYLNGQGFMQVLPLLCFLRAITRTLLWEPPAHRACFVFDDPSLYWRTYGYLDFERLAEHAVQHNYSVALATIPLDTWWVNRGVSTTLRAHCPRLSVLAHGNNHASHEMLAPTNGTRQLQFAAQSLRRMERLSTRHNVAFSRVMEAPHGALDSSFMPHLLALGYEGALCTTQLLAKYNPKLCLSPILGMKPAEILGGGLPIIPRIIMSPNWRNDVLLAAFLRQPIVLAGHHQDAANGMHMLTEFAALVNSIGGIIWSDLGAILAGNFEQRRFGDTLSIRLFSRKVTLRVPTGTRRVQIFRPWIPEGTIEKIALCRTGETPIHIQAGSVTEALEVAEDETIEIASELNNSIHFSTVAAPTTSPWLVARKILMEARDRLSPVFSSVERPRRPVDPNIE